MRGDLICSHTFVFWTVTIVVMTHTGFRYSRVKILNPRPRKLPLVQARLLLLTAVLQVLKNGLKLIGVDAVESM